MVELLVIVLVVCLVAGLLVWLVDSIPLPHPFNVIAKVAIVLIAVLVILQRSGLI